MTFPKTSKSLALLAMSSVSTFALAPAAYALGGSIQNATPLSGIGSSCSIRANISIGGTDDDDGFGVDNYRLKLIAPNTISGIGTDVVNGEFNNFQTVTRTRTLSLTASDIAGTPLANAGPNAVLQVALEDVTGFQNAPVAGPFEDTFDVTLSALRQSGSNACVQVANAISPNRAPNANAGPDQTLTGANLNVSLDASATTDPDGDPIASYAWTQISGPTVALSGANTATPSFTFNPTAVTVLEFQVRVSDGLVNGSATDRVVITLNPAQNSGPTVNAAISPTTLIVPERLPVNAAAPAFNLDASNSTDPDSDPLTYSWAQVSGPSFTIADPNAATTTATASSNISVDTVATFSIAVTDATGSNQTSSGTLSRQIDFDAQPTADAGADQTVTYSPGQQIFFNGSGSTDDKAITGYEWVQVSGPAVNNSAGSTTTLGSVLGITAGTDIQLPTGITQTTDFGFELRVSDGVNRVDQRAIDGITITAQVVNQPPVPDAGNDITDNNYTPGTPIQLDGSGSTDPEGDPLTYTWSNPTGLSGITFSDPNAVSPTLSVSQAFFGGQTNAQFIVNLTVNDGNGNSTSDQIIVTLQRAVANQVPTADAGPDETLNNYTPGTATALTVGTSSDPDNDPLTFQWRITGNPPAGISLTNASTSAPSIAATSSAFSNSNSISVSLELTVDDGNGGTATDTKTVTFTRAAVNQVPVANAGPDQTISGAIAGGQVRLDGSGSSDPDGDPLTYTWTQTAGPTVTLAGLQANPATPSFSIPAGLTGSTDIEFRLVVTDGTISSPADTVRITLNPQTATNQTPIADAGADIVSASYRAGSIIQLDGTNSSDADGDPLTYQWTQIAGPSVSLSSATIAQPGFFVNNLTAQTVYTFELVVNDGTTASVADSVTVDLTPAPPNRAPTIDAGPDQTFTNYTPGDRVNLSGEASSDPDGDPLNYFWTITSNSPDVILVNAATRNPGIIARPAAFGTNQTLNVDLELEVDDGTVGGFDTKRVTFDQQASANQAPVANAGPNISDPSYVSGSAITLDGSGSSDPDGDPLTYSWRQLSGPTGGVSLTNTSSAQATFSVTGISAARQYSFELTVSDGTSSDVSSVTVNVTPAASTNQAPSVDAGPDITFNNAPLSSFGVSQATATDPDGDTLTVNWSQISGPTISISDPSILNPRISYDPMQNPSQQTAVLRLSVDDGNNPPVTDDVTVTLNPRNAPVADAGPDQTATVIAGAAIQLDASGSSDVNNDNLTYTWFQRSGPTVTLDDAALVQPSFQVPAGLSGNQRLEFGVQVGDGTTNRTDTVIINLTLNDPPVADAGVDQRLNSPAQNQTITLDGNASSDPNGDALTYTWTQISGRAVTLSDPAAVSPTFSYTQPSGSLPSQEDFIFDLIVNDGSQDSPRDQVSVSIINNTAPVASAGSALSNIDAGATVTLDATGSSDPDGDALTYAWRQVSGPSVILQSAATATPSFTAPNVQSTQSIVFEVEVSDGDLTDTAQVTVEVRPTGSITIVQVTQGGDFGFGFTSNLAALTTTLGTSNGTAQVTASNVVAGTYSIAADDAKPFGYALTGLTCSDTDSTTDLAARTASIVLAPGEDVTCTFTSVNSRSAAQKQIKDFLSVRNTLLLSNGPDLQRRMDRLNGTVQRGSVSAGGYILPNSDQQPITAELDEQGGKVSTSLQTFQAGKSDIDRTGQGSLDVWVEGTFATFDLAGRSGDFSLFYGGVDYLLTDDLLVGGVVQLDQIDQEGDRNGLGAADGNGYMIGPYVTARLQENLFVDARAAIGQSENTISPLGTYKDQFETDRALVEASVFGDWKVEENTIVRPTVSIRHISELQKGYTDSLGVGVGNQAVNQGELSFAPRVQTLWQASDTLTLRPYAELEGIYTFGDDAEQYLGSETRLRFEAGSDLFSTDNLTGSLSIFADGIGTEDYQAQGLRFQFSYTFE